MDAPLGSFPEILTEAGKRIRSTGGPVLGLLSPQAREHNGRQEQMSASSYIPSHSIVIEGDEALATLEQHLDTLGIHNPRWIISSSAPSVLKRMRSTGDEDFPFDAVITAGGVRELSEAQELFSAESSSPLPFILIPSAPIPPSILTAFPVQADLTIIDTRIASSLKVPEIKKLITLSLFYLFSSLIEGYDPMLTVQGRFILSRAMKTQKALLSSSRKEASVLALSMLPSATDLGRNRRSSLLLRLMEEITVEPFSVYNTAGMLLIPLAQYISQSQEELFELLNEATGEQDPLEWLLYWKEGISETAKEETLRQLTLRLDALFSAQDTPERLSSFIPFLREEELR